MTVELSSFGRPKEEKLKPHLRPLREAATTTWSKHSLGHSQPSQPGSQRGQPATHHRQRETSDVREPPEDTHSRHGDKRRRRNGSSTPEDLVVSRVLFPSVVKEDLGVVPFGCEGRPGVVSTVLFPSGVKEDQLSWVL
ncbi:hypothetical protein Taro_011934 [Colocasia esculenta]|uniref:Uncharacterized protein n=1 Tax=Colocasia esculenta TaxID=4460 RepID=A0A843UC45_COLES|nr:hypothetical protein [Colocasia esculenta]